MGDSIRSSITKVLPDLSALILEIVLETLQLLGVETSEDLQFISETDLNSVLRPVQARKLLAAWKQTVSIMISLHNSHEGFLFFLLCFGQGPRSTINLSFVILFYSTKYGNFKPGQHIVSIFLLLIFCLPLSQSNIFSRPGR